MSEKQAPYYDNPEWHEAYRDRGGEEKMEEIKQTLRNILQYIGADSEYANHAQLQTWLEQLIKKNR